MEDRPWKALPFALRKAVVVNAVRQPREDVFAVKD